MPANSPTPCSSNRSMCSCCAATNSFADAASHGEALMPPGPRSRPGAAAAVCWSTPASRSAGLRRSRHARPSARSLSGAFGASAGQFSHCPFRPAGETSSIAEALLPHACRPVVDDAGRPAALRPQAMLATVASSYPLPLIPVSPSLAFGKRCAPGCGHCSRYRSLASRSFASAGRVADFGRAMDTRQPVSAAPRARPEHRRQGPALHQRGHCAQNPA